MDCLSLREPLFFGSQKKKIISGLATGGVYALVALGLVLIHKATHVINFAQGDLLMVGAYSGWALTMAGVPFPIAFVLTLIVAAGAGVLIERLVLRRMIGAPIVAMIIVTLGLSSMLRGLMFLAAGTGGAAVSGRHFLRLSIRARTVPGAAGVRLGSRHRGHRGRGADVVFQVFATGYCAARGGRRSAGGHVDGMGIRISSTFGLSWALAASVAAAGGILLGNLTGVNFTLADLGLQVFPVVILGGLDSFVGAIVGGFLIGVLQNVASGYLDPCAGWRSQARVSVLRPDRHSDGEAIRPVRARRH